MTSLKRALILAGIAWSAVTALMAAEHHGVVTFHGLPVPGAVVTAVQGDQKLTTSTDDDGTYSFRDLPDGTWTVEIAMAGFAKISREIGVASGAPPAVWDLKLAPRPDPNPGIRPPPPPVTSPPARRAKSGIRTAACWSSTSI